MRSRRNRGPGLAGLPVFVAAVLLTQPALGEREYDFAKALWQRGYHDLAIAQYQRVLAREGVAADERSRAHFDLAQVYQERAEQLKDAPERQAMLDRAMAELDLALKEAGGNVVLLFSARQQKALLSQNAARSLAAMLGRPDFAGDRAQTRAAALKAFDESAVAFRKLSDEAQAVIAKTEREKKPDMQKVVAGLQNERVNALLRALWSDYYGALLFDTGDLQRRPRLEKARDGFAQFAKDWDGFLVSLYGHLGEGAAHLELGDHQKAQGKFTTVLLARNLPAAREVVVQALIYRATSYNATDQAAKALEDLDGALALFTGAGGAERSELGRQALLEKAKALEQLSAQVRGERPRADDWKNMAQQALLAARAVAGTAGPFAAEAITLVTRLLATLGATEAAATAAEAYAVGEMFFRQDRYAQARDSYRHAVELARPGDTAVPPKAWFGLGRCLYAVKRFREAAIVFEYVGQTFPESAEGPRAAYLAVGCWNYAFDESKQPAERRAWLLSLELALARYGNDPRVVELRLLRGQLLALEGRYEDALRSFQEVKEGTPGYAAAQYHAGMLAWDWFVNLLRRGKLGEDRGKAQYDLTIGHLKRYLELVKAPASDEDRERVGNARVVLATVYGDILGDARTAYGYVEGHQFPAALEDRVLPLRLKGLIQQNRVDEALALLNKARQAAAAKPERFQEVLQLIGQALDEQAQKLREQNRLEEYRAAAARTADFLLGILKENPNQEPAMYQFVASRLSQIERYKEAQNVLTILLERLGADPKNKDAVLAVRLDLVEVLRRGRAWAEAIQQLKALQQAFPDSARLKTELATCYVESGQTDLGLPILVDLFRSVYKPGTAPWYAVGLTLGRAYEKTGRPKDVLSITGYVKVLYPDFWAGRDVENLELSEQYKELHKRCGGD